MINYINANLLDSDCNYICHQVNCCAKMGSGVAKQIRDKWPEVFSEYIKVSNKYALGRVQVVKLEKPNIPMQRVVNMFAQEGYGYNGKKYTSYDAFWDCLNELKEIIPERATVAFPYKIGCGLGGANWEIIEKMIDIVFKDYGVFIYKLEE